MTCYIFYKESLGKNTLLSELSKCFPCKTVLISGKVDLSLVDKNDSCLLIILNKSIIGVDFKKLFDDILVNANLPLLVIKKLKTFCTVFFNNTYKIDSLSTNKVYPFSGILYIPKGLLLSTISETLESLDINTLRYIIIKHRGNYDN